jgi:hypothetical protein
MSDKVIKKSNDKDIFHSKSNWLMIVKVLLVVLMSPLVLTLIALLFCLILGLAPFALLGFLIYKMYDFKQIKHLRKMKLEYKLKSKTIQW